MRRQDQQYTSEIAQQGEDIALVTEGNIANATAHFVTLIRDCITSAEVVQQGNNMPFRKEIDLILLDHIYHIIEDKEAIWENNRPSFIPNEYSSKEQPPEEKGKTDLLMERMLLKHCEILTGDEFLAKIRQNGQHLTPTEYKQFVEEDKQQVKSQNKDSVQSTVTPVKYRFLKKSENDQLLIPEEDIEQIKSRVNEILQSEHNHPENFIIVLYSEAPESGTVEQYPYIALENRAATCGEVRGEQLRRFLDKEIKCAKSESSESTLKTALCEIATNPEGATQAAANILVIPTQEVIGQEMLEYFMKGIVTLTIPHLQETYKQYSITFNQLKTPSAEKREEARVTATNTLLNKLADSLEKQGSLHWTRGFYVYLNELLQIKSTKIQEMLKKTPSSFTKLCDNLAQIENLCLGLKQDEKELTPDEIKQINTISIYLRSLISLGRQLGVFPENMRSSTFKTEAQANQEIKIIEKFILPFIPSKDSTVNNLLSFVEKHTPDIKNIALWFNGLTKPEQENAKKTTAEEIKTLLSDLASCIKTFGTSNEKYANTLLPTFYQHALQSVVTDDGTNDAKESLKQAAVLLRAYLTDNDIKIDPTAKENINRLLTEVAQKAEANKIPLNDIARMTIAIVGLCNNKSNANRFQDEKYLWAILKIIASMEKMHEKKDPHQLATSLLNSTIKLLNNFTQTNAELITTIKPIYEGLVTTQQADEAIPQLKEATESFFASQEKIHERYDTFKQDCKTQESHLSFGKTVLKAVTKFFAFLVGITPVIIDGLRFFKNIRANYVEDVANAIESVRGKIRKQETQENEQEKVTSSSTTAVDTPAKAEYGLNSAETATAETATGSPPPDDSDSDSDSDCSQRSRDSYAPTPCDGEKREEAPVPHQGRYLGPQLWHHTPQPTTTTTAAAAATTPPTILAGGK